MLRKKFSKPRIDYIKEQYKKRMAFIGEVKYHKLNINIRERQRATKLMNNEEIATQEIEV
jgi:hypothetical protein